MLRRIIQNTLHYKKQKNHKIKKIKTTIINYSTDVTSVLFLMNIQSTGSD